MSTQLKHSETTTLLNTLGCGAVFPRVSLALMDPLLSLALMDPSYT